MRHKTRSRSSHVPTVRIVTVADMANIAAELRRVSAPGVSAVEKAQVVNWAMTYSDAYFRTRKGNLRRVLPKGRLEVPIAVNEEEKADGAD